MSVWYVHPFWPDGYGEKLLLGAILRRAAYDIALYRGSQRLKARRLWRKAYEWMMSDDESHFTSFVSICTILGWDPMLIRSMTDELRREDVKKFDMVG
jgi:hypothetical protein